MGVYKLPLGRCGDLTRLIKDFWWGVENGKRKMHWVSWDIMLRPKNKGGIGFKDMRMFNQALLARQAWRLLQHPESLCAQVLKAKYYPHGNLADTVFSGNASSTWQAIEYGLELLKNGVIWRIGNGASVRIWRDPWIPRNDYFKAITPKRRCRLKWVSELLNPDGTWNEQLLHQHFYPIDIEAILRIRTSRRNDVDFLAWQPDQKGQFSVKSAYAMGMEHKERDEYAGYKCKTGGDQQRMGTDMEKLGATKG
jgi:hypothetical protein